MPASSPRSTVRRTSSPMSPAACIRSRAASLRARISSLVCVRMIRLRGSNAVPWAMLEAPADLSYLDTQRARLKAYIDSQLADSGMSVETIAIDSAAALAHLVRTALSASTSVFACGLAWSDLIQVKNNCATKPCGASTNSAGIRYRARRKCGVGRHRLPAINGCLHPYAGALGHEVDRQYWTSVASELIFLKPCGRYKPDIIIYFQSLSVISQDLWQSRVGSAKNFLRPS